MNFFAWNDRGARLAPLALAAIIGLELANLSWQFLPEPVVTMTSSTPVLENQTPAQNHAITLAAIVESLRQFNPWEPPVVLQEKPLQPPPPPVVKEVVVESNLDLNLIGTMILPNQAWAILTRKKDLNTQIVLQVGEEVDGATLKQITRKEVLFDNHGRTERIAMQELLKSATASVPGARPAPPGNPVLSRAEYEGMLDKGMGLLAGVNVTPFYQGADSVGYRIKFPEGKLDFQKVGLVNDDVIQQVNGIPVTDTLKMTQLANELRTQSAVRIDLLRDNRVQTIEINIAK